MAAPVKRAVPAKRAAPAARRNGPSSGTSRSAPANATSTCVSTNGTSGWRGDHSEVKTIWSAKATAQRAVSASPSHVAGTSAPPDGRARRASPATASATPPHEALRTRRASAKRAMNGTTRTESPVRNPERAGVVWRSPTVWSANPASMNRPSMSPSRRRRGPGRSRRRSQAAPRTAAAIPKRAARNSPGDATASTAFTKWKVVPQSRVRTRSARSAMRGDQSRSASKRWWSASGACRARRMRMLSSSTANENAMAK